MTASTLEAMPILARQVETARQQTEDAIVSLTDQFAGIVTRLEAVLASTQKGVENNAVSSDTQHGERQLQSVLEALRAILDSRNALAQQIRGLVAYTEELRKMSSEVESIGFRTNMVALNAAIEAAHVGDAGKGFAVVAQEVRSLSNAARETGKSISEKAGLINKALLQITATHEQVESRDQVAVTQSQAQIRDVIERFKQRANLLSAAAVDAGRQSAAIKQEISDALVQLQFQDRTSQILRQVVTAMTDLGTLGSQADGDAAAQEYLSKMTQSYTTDEQRRNHEGLGTETLATQDTTFF